MSKNNLIIRALIILLFYSLFLNLPYFHLKEFQGEEGRRVMIAANMLETGEWIVPHVEGEMYLNKPPLFNWLLAGMFGVAGVASETTSRLLSVIVAFLCALILSFFWRKMSGVHNIWFILPGLIFLTFPDVMDKAMRAEIDMTFTFFITISLLSWFYLYEFKNKPLLAWMLSLSFIGISFLTKGIQAPFFFYCGVVPYLIFYKRELKNLFSLSHLTGIFICLLIILLWLIPASYEAGFMRIPNAWINEILVRKEPLREGGFLRHFIEFPFSYILAYMPWLLFIGFWFYRPLKHEDIIIKKLAVFCLMCLLFSVPFYWLIPGARLRYLLPLSGMLSLLITIPMNTILVHHMEEPGWRKWYTKFLGILLAALVISSPFWGKKLELFENIIPIIFLGGVFIIALILVFTKDNLERIIVKLLLVALMVKLFWASFYFPYYAKHHSYYRNAAKQINEMVPPDVILLDYKVDNQHLTFYLKRPVKLIDSPDKNLGKDSVVFMKKRFVEGLDLKGFSYIGEVKARKEVLVLYKAKIN